MIITNKNYTEILNEAIRNLKLDVLEMESLSPKFTSDPDIKDQAELIFNVIDVYNKVCDQDVVHAVKSKIFHYILNL